MGVSFFVARCFGGDRDKADTEPVNSAVTSEGIDIVSKGGFTDSRGDLQAFGGVARVGDSADDFTV